MHTTAVSERFWYHGWNVMGLAILLQALTIGLLVYSFTFWVDPWMTEFGIERREIMLAATVYSAAIGLAGPLIGRAIDALSIRSLVVVGLVSMTVGLLIISVSRSFWQILAVYAILMPVAASFAGPFAAQTLMVRWFHERRGFALGIVSLGTSVGGVVLPVVVTALLGAVGWRVGHQGLALFAVVVVPLAWWVLSVQPPRPPGAAGLGGPVPTISMSAIFRMPAFWLLALMFAPMYFLINGFQYNFAPFASDAGIDASTAALMVSTLSLAMILGKVSFGWLLDRVAHRLVFAGAALGMCLSLCAVTLAPPGLMIASVFLLGFFHGSVLTMKSTMVAANFGADCFGRATGLLSPLLMTSAVAAVLVGWLRDVTGSYDAAFLGLAVAVLPGILLAFLIRRR